jgi:hypothetical protein
MEKDIEYSAETMIAPRQRRADWQVYPSIWRLISGYGRDTLNTELL